MQRPDLNLSAEDGLDALRAHVVERALEARAKYGPRLDAAGMHALVADPNVVRFKTRIVFDAAPLRAGEFGWARPVGDHPQAGFELVLHPDLEGRPEDWCLCAAYHLVTINYLDVATSVEAEAFGASLLGMERDAYYERLCAIADSLPNALGEEAYHLPGQALAESSGCGSSTAAPEPAAVDPLADFLAPALAAAQPAPGPRPGGSCGSGCGCG